MKWVINTSYFLTAPHLPEDNPLCRKGGDSMKDMSEEKQGTPVSHVDYYVTASVTYPLCQDYTT
jgi:hypothetical protein